MYEPSALIRHTYGISGTRHTNYGLGKSGAAFQFPPPETPCPSRYLNPDLWLAFVSIRYRELGFLLQHSWGFLLAVLTLRGLICVFRKLFRFTYVYQVSGIVPPRTPTGGRNYKKTR